MQYIVTPSTLSGTIRVPPSKSHTLRAILFASLAKGTSTIHHFLPSPDTNAMINACRLLGAQITILNDKLTIIGTAGRPQTASDVIDCGNSGQVLRFIAAIGALAPGYTVLTGDASIRSKRPILPLLNALTQLGGFAVSTKNDGYAPIIIKGPLRPGVIELNGEDSQPVSAALMVAAFLPGTTEIHVHNPGEKPWISLTLDWFDRLGIRYQNNDFSHYTMMGGAAFDGFEYTVPSDFSSAAFPIVAALITHSEITLENIDMQDVQGDKAIIPALQSMGAQIEIDPTKKLLHVKKSAHLQGKNLAINDYIDAAPILAVMGCFVEGDFTISDAHIAKQKECDRLSSITEELRKLGGNITEHADGLSVRAAALTGAQVYSHHDHRMAMSLAIAGLAAQGTTIIDNVACVDKSFPNFAQMMQQIGADIKEID